ncbi:ABC transporter ATP-binding protein [Ktedonosporobacter rubrisoli]|uniref:ABC transporter ATP-binding protein n=1 Tax=Ktedonosporobacter rubrisoli TaxID=2509675 RepID=A0A4P6JST9_KTERU|nr:ABC transporter ATP-binding protein [Ktedonosporobacter rubrisoli]QBD78343.1 ABC transporter ATP-binding protein [Ktedonosporobacter rubrisoli]
MCIVYDIQNLVKTYPGQASPANKHITLQIQQGEIFGILGDNGAGKTTLVRQMVNLQASTAGRILLFGQDIRRNMFHVPLHVGYMPQQSQALNNLTVSEALFFTAHLRGMSRAQASKERDRLLQLWQIEDLRNAYSPRLSGGQKRLLRLAVTAAGSPKVLILDEPTNDLDPQRRNLVWNVLRQINEEYGTTIIFITHDAIEAEKIIQRVGIMSAGELVAVGRPSDLKRSIDRKMRLEIFFPPERPPHLPVHLSYHQSQPGRWLILLDREEALTTLDTLHIDHLDDFRLYSATLEDIYLHYVSQ